MVNSKGDQSDYVVERHVVDMRTRRLQGFRLRGILHREDPRDLGTVHGGLMELIYEKGLMATRQRHLRAKKRQASNIIVVSSITVDRIMGSIQGVKCMLQRSLAKTSRQFMMTSNVDAHPVR